jgi:hypothetical protein
MRTILAACLAALVLAGCTAGYGNGPKADPNGSKTYPPTPDSNTTGPPTGSDVPTPTSSASSTYSTSFAEHSQDDSASDANYPGLGVNGHLSGSGSLVHLEVTANDFGERTYRVPDGQCAQPFTEMMSAPDGSGVQVRAPVAGCTGFALRDFKPGDYESKGLDWNGTVWDAVQGRFVPATPGTYTWTLTAHLYPSDATSQSQSTDLTLEFQVHLR